MNLSSSKHAHNNADEFRTRRNRNPQKIKRSSPEIKLPNVVSKLAAELTNSPGSRQEAINAAKQSIQGEREGDSGGRVGGGPPADNDIVLMGC